MPRQFQHAAGLESDDQGAIRLVREGLAGMETPTLGITNRIAGKPQPDLFKLVVIDAKRTRSVVGDREVLRRFAGDLEHLEGFNAVQPPVARLIRARLCADEIVHALEQKGRMG